MSELHLEVLPRTQLQFWGKLQSRFLILKQLGYYLAGGTALALQLGHRQSVDFDFFSNQAAIASKTHQWLEQFPQLILRDRDQHTIHAEVQGIKISFIGNYRYSLIEKPVKAESVLLASVLDVALMKLLAITHRATLRDYLDLAAILKARIPLDRILELSQKKYGKEFNPMIPIKALLSFEDIDMEKPVLIDKSLGKEWKTILSKAVFKTLR